MPPTASLTTARLRLEPLLTDDARAVHRHWGDPEVRRYLWDGRTVSEREVSEILATSQRLFRERAAGLWGIRCNREPTLVGTAGYWDFHDPPETELLVSLAPDSWSRGLATEAAEALIDYAFDRLGWPTVQASADTPNTASLDLISRLGMRPAGVRPGEFGTIDVFRIDRREWRSRD